MFVNLAQRTLQLAANVTSRAADGGGHRLLTLIYHRVLENPDFMRPNETLRQKFEWQMMLLANFFRVFPLSEALTLQREGALPARSVAITFDDGYADNFQTALPVLSRYDLPATFFVASGFLDGGRMWNDSVIEAVRRIPGNTLDLSDEGLGVFDLSTPPARADAASRLLREIKHLQPPARKRLTDTIISRSSGELPNDLMMTSGELRKLSASGMEIGGHTMSHPILANLCAEESRREILGGKQALEVIIDREISLFAYPNGRAGQDYQAKDVAIVDAAGFTSAVTTHWGVSESSTDQFQLPRFTPWDRTPVRFMARMAAMYRNAVI